MMREVSPETLPNVNIRDPSHDKNLPIKKELSLYHYWNGITNLIESLKINDVHAYSLS